MGRESAWFSSTLLWIFFFFFVGEGHFEGEETPSKHFQHETQAEHCKEEAADGAQRVKKKR